MASVVPGILVLVLAMMAVGRSGGRADSGAPADARRAAEATVSAPVRPTALYAIVAFYLLRMPETLLLLRTQQLGVSVTSVLLLWAALHVVRSSSSFVGGALSDRIGAGRTMWAGWVCYAAVAYGFARAADARAAWVLFLVFGVV